ncbi:MAG: winged helix-turn-helix domain-containing protein [Niabella sp.]
MVKIRIVKNDSLSKVEQIATSVRQAISNGTFQKNQQLPSINEFSHNYSFARDTVEKAYGALKKEGLISSVKGRGYFVLSRSGRLLKVLLVMNKLSAYKKIVYNSFIKKLGSRAKVDLQIHHYNLKLLTEIIQSSLGKYNYFVIMPHFTYNIKEKDIAEVLSMISKDQLIILDKQIKILKGRCTEIYQDFEHDIYKALLSAGSFMKKYSSVVLILNEEGFHPREIVKGVKRFCNETGKTFQLTYSAEHLELQKRALYIETLETDLSLLIKKSRAQAWNLGQEIGIISFNETILKELLNITVVTTDFQNLGIQAASSILEGTINCVKNPFYMIRRGSI